MTKLKIPLLNKTLTLRKKLSDKQIVLYNILAWLAGLAYLLLSSAVVAAIINHLFVYYGYVLNMPWYHPLIVWLAVGETRHFIQRSASSE